MSDGEASPVFLSDGDDPDMRRAMERARATFRHFWREVTWERQRIVPGLDLACVKAPFTDGGESELMWIDDVDFDGETVGGVLLNTPERVTSVRAGDDVRLPLARVADWLYAIDGEVCGAFTVHVLRSRMGAAERADHDAAWGLDFGDPSAPRVVPATRPQATGGGGVDSVGEHPMSESTAPELARQLTGRPELLTWRDDRGWSLLHVHALAGNALVVRTLLDAGADRDAVTADGRTPAQLARALGWDHVAALLSA